MLRKLVITCVTALATAACATLPQEDERGLALRTDRTEYRAGDPLEITLANGTDQQAGYNLCVSALDARSGADWVAVQIPLVEACTMELRTLEPGGTANFRHTLPAALPAGEYRVRTSVESPLGSGMVGVASGPFRVNP